jgi:hypothetical protein
MLRDIVREVVSQEHDLEIVDEHDEAAALATIRASGSSVVVTQFADHADERIGRLLGAGPHVRVLALSRDGREGAIYDRQSEERRLGEISPPVLLAALRAGDPYERNT